MFCFYTESLLGVLIVSLHQVRILIKQKQSFIENWKILWFVCLFSIYGACYKAFNAIVAIKLMGKFFKLLIGISRIIHFSRRIEDYKVLEKLELCFR